MSTRQRLFIGGTIALLGLGVALTAGAATRGPWTRPIELPSGDEILAAKTVVCTCIRGGLTGKAEVVRCTVQQIYQGEADWSVVLGTSSMDGDDPSVAEAVAYYNALVDEALAAQEAGDLDEWCEEPTTPGLGDLPFAPPTDEPDDPIEIPDITLNPAGILATLISDSWEPGKFVQIQSTGFKGGLSQAAREALRSAGINNPSSQLVVSMMRAFSEGEQWNRRIYSRARRADKNEYWASNGRHIGPAWLPRHKNATQAVANARYPESNIFDDGKKIGPGSSYGLVWTPKFDVDAARNLGVLVVEEVDPPESLLNLLS